MPQMDITQDRLKQALKDALVEVLEERRDYLRDVIEEVLEDFEMVEDVQDKRQPRKRKPRAVFAMSEGEA